MLYAGSQPAGYAGGPLETVNYVGCHDGEALFDQLIMKAPEEVGHAAAGFRSQLHTPSAGRAAHVGTLEMAEYWGMT